MLPILRLISVGGVSLAIAIVLLALNPPQDARVRLARVPAPASGPLIDRNDHPEWRQFLIHAALRRASAVEELRTIPDTRVPVAPVVSEPLLPIDVPEPEKGPSVAELPPQPYVGEPDLPTGAIGGTGGDADNITIPVDIGAASSLEIIVSPVEEAPPVTTIPKADPRRETRRPPRTRAPRQAIARAPANAPAAAPVQMNLFEALLVLLTIKPDTLPGRQPKSN